MFSLAGGGGYQEKFLYAFILSSKIYYTSYLILPFLLTLIKFSEEFTLGIFTLCEFLHPYATSSPLGSGVPLRIPLSNSLNHWSSLRANLLLETHVQGNITFSVSYNKRFCSAWSLRSQVIILPGARM